MLNLVQALMAAARHRDSATLVYESAITAADMHIATKDGEAMFFHDSIDFSSYAGNDTGSTPYRLVFTDSSGNEAVAWGGAAGGGEALGANPYAGFDFTSGWGFLNCAAIDADTLAFSASYGLAHKGVSVAGRLYKGSFDASSASLAFNAGGVEPIIPDGTADKYATAVGAYILRIQSTSIVTADVTVLSLKALTDVPATGLHLMSEQDGTTRNMTSQDTGFDPNGITKVEIYS